MIYDAIMVYDKKQHSPTSNLLQHILDKTEHLKSFFLSGGAGIKEYRIIDLVDNSFENICQSELDDCTSEGLVPATSTVE
jgi:hypothetical protein